MSETVLDLEHDVAEQRALERLGYFDERDWPLPLVKGTATNAAVYRLQRRRLAHVTYLVDADTFVARITATGREALSVSQGSRGGERRG